MRKPTTLMGGKFRSRHFGTKPYLTEALRLTGKEQPLALYVGVASGEDRAFGTAVTLVIEGAGAREVWWPKLATKKPETAAACAALAEVDLVFVGGGDVYAGMQVLRDRELIAHFHAAAERGVVFAGMSAGAIMLGERWIRWPDEGAGDAAAQTFECLGLARCSLDTHGEGDGWQEARSFAAVRAREIGTKACVYGVPSGAALVVHTDGTVHARGVAAPLFVALPNKQATIETTLEAN